MGVLAGAAFAGYLTVMSDLKPDLRHRLAVRFFRLAMPMNLLLVGMIGLLFAVMLGPAAQQGGLALSTGLIASLLAGLTITFALVLAGAEYYRCRRQANALIAALNGPAGAQLRLRRSEAGDIGWQRDVWLDTLGLFTSSALQDIGELRLRQLIARDRKVSELLDLYLQQAEAPPT